MCLNLPNFIIPRTLFCPSLADGRWKSFWLQCCCMSDPTDHNCANRSYNTMIACNCYRCGGELGLDKGYIPQACSHLTACEGEFSGKFIWSNLFLRRVRNSCPMTPNECYFSQEKHQLLAPDWSCFAETTSVMLRKTTIASREIDEWDWAPTVAPPARRNRYPMSED